MAGGNSFLVNRRTRPYYSRRCKRRQSSTNIDSLPDDLVFRILLLLSAQDIYNVARLVCWKWYNIIHTDNFIEAHLQHSNSGLLIQSGDDLQHPIFLTMLHDRVEVSKFSYEFGSVLWGSCNGLIIQQDLCNEECVPYIANPATKQSFALPRLPECAMFYSGRKCCMGFASPKEYKVVCTFKCGRARQCYILTVGVDKSWRPVCTQHLPSGALYPLCSAPHVTDGFMHWLPLGDPHFLTLNIKTEIITQIAIPQGCENKPNWLLPSQQRYLSLLSENNDFFWEVWVMEPEIGEWMKLQNINLEAHKCTFDKFVSGGSGTVIYPKPRGWLKYKEVLMLSFLLPTELSFTYNLRTQELDVLELDIPIENFDVHAHRSSLVRPGGCSV